MRQWVEGALQTRLRSVDPLTGGWTSTMLLDFIKAPRRLAAAPGFAARSCAWPTSTGES